ncbi:hypothetical protein JCGZ_10365 [Jatropha curcas]|uniref:Uncharacterized protein n=1 Tax=Jatropha curcas TaxID=180498 RepID=A0A067KGM2_JATCU|nr:hypothetical protein JCGZ_10365 [Jatropha curcas]
MERKLKGLHDQEATIADDLVKTCLSLRANILSELKTRNPEADWSWVNEIYTDEVEEDEKDKGAKETRGDTLLQSLSVEDLPSQSEGNEVAADIHAISAKGQNISIGSP